MVLNLNNGEVVVEVSMLRAGGGSMCDSRLDGGLVVTLIDSGFFLFLSGERWNGKARLDTRCRGVGVSFVGGLSQPFFVACGLRCDNEFCFGR